MQKNNWIKYHFPVILWMLIIFTQSSFPSVDLPKFELIGFDKLIHIGVYSLLAILSYLSIIHQSKVSFFTKNPYTWAIIISSVYGITDEIHQYFVPNRSCELQDWIADLLGAISGVIIVKLLLIKYFRHFTNE